MSPRHKSKFLTLFDIVFELAPEGSLLVEIVSDDGVALHTTLSAEEVGQLRDLLNGALTNVDT